MVFINRFNTKKGIFEKVSNKYLGNYLLEFSYKYNIRNSTNSFMFFNNINNYDNKLAIMDEKEKKKLAYEDWANHMRDSKERAFYSEKRADLLIITVSGGGIYLAFNHVANLEEISNIKNGGLLFISAVCLITSILLNIIGQTLSKKGNTLEEKYAKLQLEILKGEDIDEEKENELDKKALALNSRIKIVNKISIISMFLGVIILTIFYYFYLL